MCVCVCVRMCAGSGEKACARRARTITHPLSNQPGRATRRADIGLPVRLAELARGGRREAKPGRPGGRLSMLPVADGGRRSGVDREDRNAIGPWVVAAHAASGDRGNILLPRELAASALVWTSRCASVPISLSMLTSERRRLAASALSRAASAEMAAPPCAALATEPLVTASRSYAGGGRGRGMEADLGGGESPA